MHGAEGWGGREAVLRKPGTPSFSHLTIHQGQCPRILNYASFMERIMTPLYIPKQKTEFNSGKQTQEFSFLVPEI